MAQKTTRTDLSDAGKTSPITNGVTEAEISINIPHKTAPARMHGTKSNKAVTTASSCPAVSKTSDLTFITSEGESITFPDLGMPIGDATAIASEDTISKIWERPAEDLAWRDM